MKVIIAGSRGITCYETVCRAVKLSGFDVTEVVSGGARGPDTLGEQWSRENLEKEATVFRAKWKDQRSETYSYSKGYDPRAGYRRNVEMAEYAEGLIALWDGESRGTKHMIEEARRCGLRVFVYRVKETAEYREALRKDL